MKKTIICMLAFLLVGGGIVTAQSNETRKGKPNREKIKKLRKAFLEEKLNLTDKEAVKFWPIFDEHSKSKRGIKKEMKLIRSSLRLSKSDNVTEEQFINTIDKLAELKHSEIDLDSKYVKKILPILGTKRTMELKKIKKDFRKKIKKHHGKPPCGDMAK